MKFFLNQLFIVFTLFSVHYVMAQKTGSQEVLVYDADTKLPLSGVVIQNKEKSVTAFTDLVGKASLRDFSNTGPLQLTHPSYISYKISKNQWIQRGGVVYLQRNAFELDEVVMSVSKWEQQKKEVPQKIIGVSAQSIAFSQPQTAADLLQQSGKVYVQKSQMGGGSPMIRGFAANRILLSVDGVRMNNAIFRGGNLQNAISVDPFTIKNTEVIFGSGSVIYGSDALGGVIHYYTKTPQLLPTDKFSVSGNIQHRYASANGEKTTHADLSFSNSKWGLLSSVSHNHFGDLQMGKYGPSDYLRPAYVSTENGVDQLVFNTNKRLQTPTAYDQLHLMQKLLYKPTKASLFSLGVHFSETSDFARYDRLTRPSKDGEGLRSAVWNYGPQKWFMTNFQWTHSPQNQFYEGLKLTAAYQQFGESRYDRDFNSTDLYDTQERVDALSLNLDIEQIKTGPLRLFYGAEFVGNHIQSVGYLSDISTTIKTPYISRYPDGSSWKTTAIYLNSSLELSNQLSFLGGLRYSHVWVDAQFNAQGFDFPFDTANLSTGAFTGSLGLSWFIAEDLQFSWNATTGFRAPNIDDIGKVFDSEPGRVVVPNPHLKPEYAYGTEVGLKKNFKDKLVLKTAAYYTYLKDALVRRDFLYNGASQWMYQGTLSQVQAMQNAAKSYVFGWELGVDFFISPLFSFEGNYSLSRGEEEDDNGLTSRGRHVTPAFGDAQLVYKNSRFKASLVYSFNSEISADMLPLSEQSKSYMYALDSQGNPYSPAWDALHIRSQYTLSNAITTYITWENIGNKRYRPYASGISAAGSNLIIGASYQF